MCRDKIARRKLYALIQGYYSAMFDNFKADDLLAPFEHSDDYMVRGIAEAFYNMYDDTRRHWWFHNWSEEVQERICAWKYMLLSNIEINSAPRIAEAGKVFWPLASEEELEKLKTMNNDRIKPLPPLNLHTLNAINKSCFFKFRRKYRVNRILQMRSRDVCRKIWQKYGCGEIYDRLPECLKITLPYDTVDVAGYLTGDFSRKRNPGTHMKYIERV